MLGGQQRERERQIPNLFHLGAYSKVEQAWTPRPCVELVTWTLKTKNLRGQKNT